MQSACIFICGWLYAGLVEYCWHRWILHSGRHAIHLAHHAAFSAGEYGPGHLLNVWAVVAAAGHSLLAWLLLGLAPAAALALSTLSYLGVLEFLHDWMHRNPGAWIARRHIAHHHVPVRNFNVFLPVWDFLFGTA